jgi:hypothetical protein
MLFRPSFCANCGERIERTDWHIWTSRRFCPVCESEYKGHDLIPRVVVVLGVLTGIFGFGSYLKSASGGPAIQAIKQPRTAREQPPVTAQETKNVLPPQPQNSNAGVSVSPPAIQNSTVVPRTTAGSPAQSQASKPSAATEEPVYYCGAETKKGTPCTRRVKGNNRCFQHIGMPAMLSSDKLRIR